MPNRKEKVSEKSAGFVDSEILTDNHDKIMIWLDSVAEQIVSDLVKDYCEGEIKVRKEWERPIVKGSSQYKTIVGYIDMACIVEKFEGEDETGRKHYRNYAGFAFEVKSKITSIGEVIRQIKQYKTFCNYSKFFIVCPDDRFEKILESQGIGFIKSPSGEDLP